MKPFNLDNNVNFQPEKSVFQNCSVEKYFKFKLDSLRQAHFFDNLKHVLEGQDLESQTSFLGFFGGLKKSFCATCLLGITSTEANLQDDIID